MFPKKKPSIGVMIGIGKGDSGGAPPKYKGESGAPPPFTSGEPAAAHESAEPPQHEVAEESGASLLSSMTAPLVAAGMQEDEAKSTLADIFEALVAGLRGKGAEAPGPEATGEPTDVPGGY